MMIHQTSLRVIYGDTDNMGMAYYANYLRWFEIGRTELFRHLGVTYRQMEAEGLFLPVSEAFCKYVSPVRYDDELRIETRVDPKIRGGIKFDYRILKADTSREAANGYTKHAWVDAGGKVRRPPAFIKEILARDPSSDGRDSV